MFEALESRELFSATLTATGTFADEPAAEPAPVVVEIKSPRDAASGQATGKRQHMPMRF